MKRMVKRTAIVISFLSITAAAWAQTPPAANEERRGGASPERGDQMEKRRAEMKQRFDTDFKKADADGDGALSKAEAEKSMPRLAKDFDAIDTNKDGKLTQDEIRARRQARMAEHHQGKGGSGSDAKPGTGNAFAEVAPANQNVLEGGPIWPELASIYDESRILPNEIP